MVANNITTYLINLPTNFSWLNIYIAFALQGLFFGIGGTFASYLVTNHVIKRLQNLRKRYLAKKKILLERKRRNKQNAARKKRERLSASKDKKELSLRKKV
jgi:Na+/glutamate symporter